MDEESCVMPEASVSYPIPLSSAASGDAAPSSSKRVEVEAEAVVVMPRRSQESHCGKLRYPRRQDVATALDGRVPGNTPGKAAIVCVK